MPQALHSRGNFCCLRTAPCAVRARAAACGVPLHAWPSWRRRADARSVVRSQRMPRTAPVALQPPQGRAAGRRRAPCADNPSMLWQHLTHPAPAARIAHRHWCRYPAAPRCRARAAPRRRPASSARSRPPQQTWPVRGACQRPHPSAAAHETHAALSAASRATTPPLTAALVALHHQEPGQRRACTAWAVCSSMTPPMAAGMSTSQGCPSTASFSMASPARPAAPLSMY